MPDRNDIIAALTEGLRPLGYAYAFWLEGADASGLVDEYSDLDFWLDFEDGEEEAAYRAVEQILTGVAPLDGLEAMRHGHPQIRQRVYHLTGTPDSLAIDFCFQLHSRPADECVFIKGNRVESAKVLFDKTGVVRFIDDEPGRYAERNAGIVAEAACRYRQLARAEKYLHRGLYLEASAYYNRYVFEPLVSLVRLLYTPANADYGLIHISHHVPAEIKEKLEYFAQGASIDAMAERLPKAKAWFSELFGRYEETRR